jgi:hypothetical protein
MKLKECIQVLQECEQKLRKLAAQALEEGDYPSVFRITDSAVAVAALAAEGNNEQPTPIALPRASSDSGNGSHEQSGTLGRVPKPSADEYPMFFRRGDELVKVGWSKKERKEYSHRAPRRVIDAVAAAVRQVGAKGRLFNGDALLPLKEQPSGATVPDYQAYLSLAWLKHLGIVQQRGRRAGYTLVPSKQIETTITSAWPELSDWRG